MTSDLALLLVLGLATIRLSNLMSDVSQGGPRDVLSKLRYWAGVRYDEQSQPYGETSLAKGLLCPYCNSVWLGLGFTALLALSPALAFWIALPWALSGVATIVKFG